jgi:hypothetical protein
MEQVGRSYDAMPHQAVISNLLDLQARLRGDPASMVVPKVGRPTVPDRVSVAHDDVVVSEVPDKKRSAPAEDRLVAGAQDAEERIEALRRRLQFLELEIDAYESVVAESPEELPQPVADANVIDLQQAVERRLTQD